ncbi:MAG: hypothetical protein KI792_12735 [Alphaproteobacteria bacterium]|nr:hypothetical protein [Alphaproteobacteria bacterium SS10]
MLQIVWSAFRKNWSVGILSLALIGLGGLVWRNHSLAEQRDALQGELSGAVRVNQMQRQLYELQLASLQTALQAARAREQADTDREQVFEPIERQIDETEPENDGRVAGVVVDTLGRLHDARNHRRANAD